MTACVIPPLIERVVRDGKHGVRYNFHPGQQRAWDSDNRIVAIVAGGQSGKTAIGPLWLYREMRQKGPGNYLVVGPSFTLLNKEVVPALKYFFVSIMGLGHMREGSSPEFIFSDEGCRKTWGTVPEVRPRILFAHADAPESIESLRANAAWCDEAGQGRFKQASYDAIQERLDIARGRTLITSKPYNLGWFFKEIYQKWQGTGGNHPLIDVINYKSTDNPVFPREQAEEARKRLPPWRYRMKYEGLFERAEGVIYDCFTWDRHVTRPFIPTPEWVRYGGLDFGGVNTAAVIAGKHPTTQLTAIYREYHQGRMTAAQHVVALTKDEPPFEAFIGGAKSEGQWRQEFTVAGLYVMEPPVSDVEVGIQRVYSMLATGRLVICENCEKLIEQIESYSRAIDESGEPTEAIENKETFHLADAIRYLCTWLDRDGIVVPDGPKKGNQSLMAGCPFLDDQAQSTCDEDDPWKEEGDWRTQRNWGASW